MSLSICVLTISINITPFSPSQTLTVTHFFFFSSCQRGDLGSILTQKLPLRIVLSFYPNWISDFTIFYVFFRLFCDFVVTLFVLISRFCAVCFWFPVLVRCLFDSGWKISFEQVQIRSMTMTLASSTLQIRKHEYFRDLNIVILVIFVGICTLPFYAINMDVVSLFTDSSFLFLANLNLYCINILDKFEWMNIIYFCKKN